MLRIYLTLTIILSAFVVFADNISVSEFKETNEIMIASNDFRKDANGNLCALIRVQAPADKAGFEGNIVGEVQYKINEYWVFLTPGTKTLKIQYSSQPSLMIDLTKYIGSPVKSKHIYQMVLNVPESRVDVSGVSMTPTEQLLFGKQLKDNNDSEAALKWFKMAAEGGNGEAMCLIGDYYLNLHHGAVKKINDSQAILWYKKSASTGYPEGMYKAASYLLGNIADSTYVRTNLESACRKNYTPAFEKLGDYYAQRMLKGSNGRNSITDLAMAEYWYLEGLKHDEANNAYKLGVFYQKHSKSKDEGATQAFEYWNRASQLNHPLALLKLGECYSKGLGVKTNQKKAFQYKELALNAGCDDIDLLLEMADVYSQSKEIKPIERAYSLLKKVVLQDNHSENAFAAAKKMITIENSHPLQVGQNLTIRGLLNPWSEAYVTINGNLVDVFEPQFAVTNLKEGDTLKVSATGYEDYIAIISHDKKEFNIKLEKMKYGLGGLTAGEAIDMGGSVLWSTRNLGAGNDHELGTLFAYPIFDSSDSFKKNNIQKGRLILSDLSGTTDDPATIKLGDGWRLPTPEEVEELRRDCKWEWEDNSLGKGMRAVSTNGNSIFLPAGVFDHIEKAGNFPGTTVYNIGALSSQTLGPYSFAFQEGTKHAPYLSQHWSSYEYAVRPVKSKNTNDGGRYVRFIINPAIHRESKHMSGVHMVAFIDGKKVGEFNNVIDGLEVIVPKGKHKLAFNIDKMAFTPVMEPNEAWPQYEIDTEKSCVFNESIIVPD